MTKSIASAKDIAKWFLAYASQDDEKADISNLKLQKLLYFAQGHHLGKLGVPLFSDEIQAWAHGPVVPSVYQEYKRFEGSPIEFDEDFDFEAFDIATNNFLASVWFTFGGFSAWKLRNMSHDEGPWKDSHDSSVFGTVISVESMAKHFGSLY